MGVRCVCEGEVCLCGGEVCVWEVCVGEVCVWGGGVCGEVCVRRGVCGGRCVCVCRERRVCVEGRRVCGGEVYENPQYYFFHHYSKVTNKETRNLIEYKEQDF